MFKVLDVRYEITILLSLNQMLFRATILLIYIQNIKNIEYQYFTHANIQASVKKYLQKNIYVLENFL